MAVRSAWGMRPAWIALLLCTVAGCHMLDSPVDRAVKNCRSVKTGGTTGTTNDRERDEAVASCELIREACEDDREGAPCRSLLRRYR